MKTKEEISAAFGSLPRGAIMQGNKITIADDVSHILGETVTYEQVADAIAPLTAVASTPEHDATSGGYVNWFDGLNPYDMKTPAVRKRLRAALAELDDMPDGEVAAPEDFTPARVREGLMAVEVSCKGSPAFRALEALSSDDLVRRFAELVLLRKMATAFAEWLGGVADRAERLVVTHFETNGIQGVKLDGLGSLYHTTEYWPGPLNDDLMAGIDEDDPELEHSVEQVKAYAKQRLINALREGEFADLLHETYNAQSLRGRIAGADCERDELGEPVIPEALAGVLVLNARSRVRFRRR